MLTTFSLAASRAEVGSSRRRIFGFLTTARAIAIRSEKKRERERTDVRLLLGLHLETSLEDLRF